MSCPDFDAWLQHVFDHPATQPAWYWQEAAPRWGAPAEMSMEYLEKLFGDPAPRLEPFSDAQVAIGLWYIVHPQLSIMMSDVVLQVSWPRNQNCILAMYDLFEKFFQVRCADGLSHRDQPTSPLSDVCYQWWHAFPTWGGGDPDREELDRGILATIGRLLELPSDACRESALHGLGHWQHAYPDVVVTLIDEFLEADDVPLDLREYALVARRGEVA